MDLATSDEPDMAGSASDLILGGGMNLRILQAIKVGLESGPDSSTGLCNVYGKTVSEWLPEQVTTWLMTPYQIEAVDHPIVHPVPDRRPRWERNQRNTRRHQELEHGSRNLPKLHDFIDHPA